MKEFIMEDNQQDFEAITLSNIWIQQHILDVIKNVSQNEIIAESGGLDMIALNDLEKIDIIRNRIDALKLMRAYILQLKDNVSQYLAKPISLKIEVELKGIDDHEDLLQYTIEDIGNVPNYFLSPNFQVKLNKLRKVKSLLINGCGEAELLMPKKDEEVKGKILEVEE